MQRSYLLFVFTEVIQEDILICARNEYWVLFVMQKKKNRMVYLRFMCTEINKNNTTTDIPDLSFRQQKCLSTALISLPNNLLRVAFIIRKKIK